MTAPTAAQSQLLALAAQQRQRVADLVDATEARLNANFQAGMADVPSLFNPLLNQYANDLAALRDQLDDPSAALDLNWLSDQQPLIANIQANVAAAADQFGADSAAETEAAQAAAADAGEEDAAALTTEALAPAGSLINPSLLFNLPSPDAIQSLVGRSADGQPLGNLFESFGADAAAASRNALMTGIAMGDAPSVVAAGLQEAMGVTRSRAMIIARTEMLGSYRMAAHETYRANSDVLGYWLWSASGNNPCAMCAGMDGTLHDLNEDLNDHPCGKCSPLPVTKPWDDILGPLGIDASDLEETSLGAEGNYESFNDRFPSLPAAQQEAIIGTKAGYAAIERGDVTLRDFAGIRPGTNGFPSTYQQRSLRDLGIPVRKADQAAAEKLAAKRSADALAKLPEWARTADGKYLYDLLRDGLDYNTKAGDYPGIINYLRRIMESTRLPEDIRVGAERQLTALLETQQATQQAIVRNAETMRREIAEAALAKRAEIAGNEAALAKQVQAGVEAGNARTLALRAQYAQAEEEARNAAAQRVAEARAKYAAEQEKRVWAASSARRGVETANGSYTLSASDKTFVAGLKDRIEGLDHSALTYQEVEEIGKALHLQIWESLDEYHGYAIEAQRIKDVDSDLSKLSAAQIAWLRGDEAALKAHGGVRVEEAEARYQAEFQARVRTYLEELRPMGGPVNFDFAGAGFDIDASIAVQGAAQLVPAEWLEASNALGDINAIGLRNAQGSGYFLPYHNGNATIAMELRGGQVEQQSLALHELMHRMETAVPQISELEAAFYAARTAGDEAVDLTNGIAGQTKLDRWRDEYIGRLPHPATNGAKSFEVLSIGAEMVLGGGSAQDLVALRSDQEYVNFVLGIFATVKSDEGVVVAGREAGEAGLAFSKGMLRAPEVPADWVSVVHDAQAKAIEEYATLRGMSVAEYKSAVSEHIQQLVDAADVSVRMSPDALKGVLDDGAFNALTEAEARGRRLDYLAQRHAFEHEEFGYKPGDPEVIRPVSGYLAPRGSDDFARVQGYGEVRMVLRDGVRERTTFTFGDSLDNYRVGDFHLNVAPRPLDDAKFDAYRFQAPSRYVEHAAIDPLDLKSVSEWSERQTPAGSFKGEYVEAQIHGGVKLSDIKEIIFDAGSPPSEALKASLEERGVAWRMEGAPPVATMERSYSARAPLTPEQIARRERIAAEAQAKAATTVKAGKEAVTVTNQAGEVARVERDLNLGGYRVTLGDQTHEGLTLTKANALLKEHAGYSKVLSADTLAPGPVKTAAEKRAYRLEQVKAATTVTKTEDAVRITQPGRAEALVERDMAHGGYKLTIGETTTEGQSLAQVNAALKEHLGYPGALERDMLTPGRVVPTTYRQLARLDFAEARAIADRYGIGPNLNVEQMATEIEVRQRIAAAAAEGTAREMEIRFAAHQEELMREPLSVLRWRAGNLGLRTTLHDKEEAVAAILAREREIIPQVKQLGADLQRMLDEHVWDAHWVPTTGEEIARMRSPVEALSRLASNMPRTLTTSETQAAQEALRASLRQLDAPAQLRAAIEAVRAGDANAVSAVDGILRREVATYIQALGETQRAAAAEAALDARTIKIGEEGHYRVRFESGSTYFDAAGRQITGTPEEMTQAALTHFKESFPALAAPDGALDTEKLAKMLGARDPSDRIHITYDPAEKAANVNIESAAKVTQTLEGLSREAPRYTADHELISTPRGMVVANSTVEVAQGQRTAQSGMEILDSLRSMIDAGVVQLRQDAARSGDIGGFGMNGYYTWAHLGFTGKLPTDTTYLARGYPGKTFQQAIKETFGKDVTRVEQLMALPGGPAWWKQYGNSYEAVMDLREGSKSRATLDHFLAIMDKRRGVEVAPKIDAKAAAKIEAATKRVETLRGQLDDARKAIETAKAAAERAASSYPGTQEAYEAAMKATRQAVKKANSDYIKLGTQYDRARDIAGIARDTEPMKDLVGQETPFSREAFERAAITRTPIGSNEEAGLTAEASGTATINGQKYYIKELSDEYLPTDVQNINEAAAVQVAHILGNDEYVLPAAYALTIGDQQYSVTPMITAKAVGDPRGYDARWRTVKAYLDDPVNLTQHALQDYIIGREDGHLGNYLWDEQAQQLIHMDHSFDFGRNGEAYEYGRQGTMHYMRQIGGLYDTYFQDLFQDTGLLRSQMPMDAVRFDQATLRAMASQRDAILKAAEDAGMPAVEYSLLESRLDILRYFAQQESTSWADVAAADHALIAEHEL